MRTETLQHVALFDKCKNFTRAREIQAAGLYPYFKPISHSEDTVVIIEGKPRIMMGSNNYLGLTHHPEVLTAAKPPIEASDFENVPTIRSTSSTRPKWAAVPSPFGPSTPTECASSIARAAP